MRHICGRPTVSALTEIKYTPDSFYPWTGYVDGRATVFGQSEAGTRLALKQWCDETDSRLCRCGMHATTNGN